jgi:FAD binding domain
VNSLPENLSKSLEREPLTMTFGRHGFFGYSLVSPRSTDLDKQQFMWWSTWEANPAPNRNASLDDIRNQLLAHHGSWKSPYDTTDHPVFRTIISLSCGPPSIALSAVERDVLVLPRYMTPRLPRWSSISGKIILMGDAAHAMPPFAGQGVSCAVEDAVVIALLLKHYLSQQTANLGDVLKRTTKAYENMRMGRLAHILNDAKKVGNTKRELTKWQEVIRDFIMSIRCQCFMLNPFFVCF